MSLVSANPVFCARHNKTGNLYYVLGEAVDCNNSSDNDATVVIYTDSNRTFLFSRSKEEFDAKFTRF